MLLTCGTNIGLNTIRKTTTERFDGLKYTDYNIVVPSTAQWLSDHTYVKHAPDDMLTDTIETRSYFCFELIISVWKFCGFIAQIL